MPTPIILGDTSGLAEGLSSGLSAFNQAIGQGLQQRRQAQGLSAFNEALIGAEGDPQAIATAYQQALSADADPQQLNALGQAYQQARQQNAFKSAFDAAMEAGGMDSVEGQNAFVLEYGKSGGDPFKAMQMFKKDQKGQTVFDKKIDEFKAESVINYIQGGDQKNQTFIENLDYLEKNLENVGRMAALTGGKAGLIFGGEYGPLQSAEFAEYERRGKLVLDGVIKVFNKAGVLPEKKLKWIRDTFAVSPYDTQEQIKGRIAALRSLAKDAGSFNEGMGALIDRYGQNIPTSEFLKLQKSAASVLDKYDQAVRSPQPERVYEKPPTKGLKKGQPMMNTETGEKFRWNGTRWVKQK